MAMYQHHDYLNLRPFHGYGDAGVPPDPSDYQVNWPGVANAAVQLWPGAAPILNAAGLNVPYADQAPAGVSAPAPVAAPSSGVSPWLLAAGAVAVWWFFLRK